MRTCEEYEVLISAFIDGALEDGDREELMAHMAHCPVCQAYFNDQIAIHDALRGLEAEAPADLTAKVMERVRRESGQTMEDEKQGKQEEHEKKTVAFPYWRRYAAMAACCAVVAIAGFWAFGGGRSAVSNVAADTASGMEDRAAVPAEDQENTAPEDSVSQAAGDPAGTDTTGGEPALAAEQPTEEESAAAVTEEESAAETENSSADGEETPENSTRRPISQGSSSSEDDGDGENPKFPSLYAIAAGETVTLTTDSRLAQTWVEETLGQDWAAGASYTLTMEQFDQVQALLEENGESFTLAMPVSEETTSDSAGVNALEDTAPEGETEDVSPAENAVEPPADPSVDTGENEAPVTYVLQAAP